jgi:hypothetical protein
MIEPQSQRTLDMALRTEIATELLWRLTHMIAWIAVPRVNHIQ